MKKPVLVIMAAGMGSRYGGLKQIDPIDKEGHIIMDFSIYDAKRAGFEKVVFIIKKENETDFKEAVGKRIEKVMDVAYVYQELTNIPDGFEIPKDRVKPWGTAHAVLSAIDEIDGPFAVINADDYYGRHAFQTIYDYLTTHEDDCCGSLFHTHAVRLFVHIQLVTADCDRSRRYKDDLISHILDVGKCADKAVDGAKITFSRVVCQCGCSHFYYNSVVAKSHDTYSSGLNCKLPCKNGDRMRTSN